MVLVRHSSLCEFSGMVWSLLVSVRVYVVWLALRFSFDVCIVVRVRVCLVFVGKGWGLWCMVSLRFLVRRSFLCGSSSMLVFVGKGWALWCMVTPMFLARRSSLCESSGMFGLCW